MKINWNFLGGGGRGGANKKNLPWGEYGYFLELHITLLHYPVVECIIPGFIS